MDKVKKDDENSSGSNDSNEKSWQNYEKVHSSQKKLPNVYLQKHIDLSYLESLYSQNVAHGVAGSQNIGNTCFLNSSIQCMSNSIDLTAYFLTKEYKKEINSDNKLGLGGDLAESWYDLLHELWEENDRSVCARSFKSTISRKAKMHDSHEFMTFFLDYLNEDLNRVAVKPYREIEEQGDDEEEVNAAKRFWKLHIDRNDSIITDLFSGQFKSTIQCPNCKWISKTYDPFNTLSLPIPSLKRLVVFFLPKYGLRKTIKIEIKISDSTLFGDLAHIIKSSQNLESEFEKLRFMIISDKQLIKLALPKEKVSKFIDENDENFLFCCDTDSKLQGDIINIPIYLTIGNQMSVHPRLLSLKNTITYGELKQLAFFYSRKFFKLPIDQTEYNNESKILAEDYKKSSDNLITICKSEYAKIFNKDTSLLTGKQKEYLSDLPYELFMKKDNNIQYIIRSKKKQLSSDKIIPNQDNEPITRLISMIKDNWEFFLEFDEKSEWLNENGAKDVNSCKKLANNNQNVSLYDCLEFFQLTEKLEKGNEWYCKKCRTHQLAYKKMELFYLPKLLIIHLKRFGNSENRFRLYANKIDTEVDFPLNDLDMSDFVNGPDAENSKYDLYAVSQHYGGCGGGHYTAVCKNNGRWYDYNDSSASLTNERNIVSSAAYVLFYRRK